VPCRLLAVSGHSRGVRLKTHNSSAGGAHRSVAACHAPGAVHQPATCQHFADRKFQWCAACATMRAEHSRAGSRLRLQGVRVGVAAC
jgi:hypothetical protein